MADHRNDCLGWEDCRCFPSREVVELKAEVERLRAALEAEEQEEHRLIRERDTERRLREEAERRAEQDRALREAAELGLRTERRKCREAVAAERERAGALAKVLSEVLATAYDRSTLTGRHCLAVEPDLMERALALAPTPPPASAETTRPNQSGHTHPWIDDDGLGKQTVQGCPGCEEERHKRDGHALHETAATGQEDERHG